MYKVPRWVKVEPLGKREMHKHRHYYIFFIVTMLMIWLCGCTASLNGSNNQNATNNQQRSLVAGESQIPPLMSSSVTSWQNVNLHIALLLPLHGPLAGPGTAVRDGFMSAYYQAAGNNKQLSVRVYDTSNGPDVNTLYQQAISDGANVVAGPLDKGQAQQLANSGRISVPTLLLNYVNAPNPPANLFQFGLSPQNEASQVAEKAWLAGHRKAIVITPAGSWGENIAQAFSQRWQQLGGVVVADLPYTSQQKLADSVMRLMHVDQSAAREKNIAHLIQRKIKFVPRRRQDFDMVFLAATPNLARQIKPMLSFYYANDIPVYATSLIYSGVPDPTKDRDLNGIIFCDSPWVLSAQNQGVNRFSRLYALGIDTFSLSMQAGQMTLSTQYSQTGATGILYLTPQRQIMRKLQWAEIKHGEPVLLG